MKKLALSTTTLAVVVLISTLLVYAAPLNIDAQSCILVESQTGQILYEQNARKQKIYPASTTKIMTAIIALENGKLDQLMTASEEAVCDIGKDGMNIGIMAGEQIPMFNLLEALLISSANETANIIAENICKTRQEFIDLMNQKAIDIGAVNTHFTNTCGMHDDNHYTTAYDLAMIGRYAMSIPKFREIVAKTEYSMPITNKHDSWPTLYSTNKLLKWPSNSSIDAFQVTGVKTGYTNPAGYNLVSSADNGKDMELIAVVMGVTNPGAKDNIYKYSMELLEYGFKNYASKSIVEKDQVVFSNVQVTGGKEGSSVDLLAEESILAILPQGNPVSENNISKREYIKSPIVAPVNKGDILGYIEYRRNDVFLGRTNVIASMQVNKPPEKSPGVFKRLIENPVFRKVVIVSIITLAGFFALRIILRTISRRIKCKKYRYFR